MLTHPSISGVSLSSSRALLSLVLRSSIGLEVRAKGMATPIPPSATNESSAITPPNVAKSHSAANRNKSKLEIHNLQFHANKYHLSILSL